MRRLAVFTALLLAGCMIRLSDPAATEESTPPSGEGKPIPAASGGTEPVTAPAGDPNQPAAGPGGQASGPGAVAAAGGGGGSGGGGTPAGPGSVSAGGGSAPGAGAPGAGAAAGGALAGQGETLEEKHISRSVGESGGVVVFWPRIVPREIAQDNRDLAAALQRQVRAVVEKAAPGRTIDFRPEPERVCPKGGCKASTVGLLLSRKDQGCLVVALVSKPGEAPMRIVPWAGEVKLRADMVPFREYPESVITVADYVPCASLLKTMDRGESAVIQAIQASMTSG